MRRAFTLIELLITLSIFSILAVVGWGLMRGDLPRFRAVNAAKRLSMDAAKLRGLATASNRETRLHLIEGFGTCADTEVWGGTWQLEIGDRSSGSTHWELLPLDAETDGADDDQSEGVTSLSKGGSAESKDVCFRTWPTLRGSGTGNADSVVFSPRGWVANPSTDFDGRGTISLVLVNQDAAREGVDDTLSVVITRAGMSRLESSLGGTLSDNAVGTATTSKGP